MIGWTVSKPTRRAAVADAKRSRQRFAPKQAAPLRAIEAVAAAARLPFDEGSALEDAIFDDCVVSEQAKALIHVFFAERATAKLPDLPPDISPARVDTVAIIGAGTMGSGIAIACANAGLGVRLVDESQAALDRGLRSIRKNYDSSVKRGRMSAADVEERLGRIHPQVGFDEVGTADLVIEAVFESLELKQSVFRALDEAVRPGAILGTNTSTLDLDVIAHATSRPDLVIGLHFFSPANVMRLVEVVRGRDDRPAHHRDGARLCETHRQAPGRRQERAGFRGQPHDVSVHVRDAVPRRRWLHAGGGRPGPHGLRHGHGHVRRG